MPLSGEEKTQYQRDYMRRKRELRLALDSHREGAQGVKSEERAKGPGAEFPTITDELFMAKRPGYFIFEKELQLGRDGKKRVCWYCGVEYETRMMLNKFCAPDCKERWLVASFRKAT